MLVLGVPLHCFTPKTRNRGRDSKMDIWGSGSSDWPKLQHYYEDSTACMSRDSGKNDHHGSTQNDTYSDFIVAFWHQIHLIWDLKQLPWDALMYFSFRYCNNLKIIISSEIPFAVFTPMQDVVVKKGAVGYLAVFPSQNFFFLYSFHWFEIMFCFILDLHSSITLLLPPHLLPEENWDLSHLWDFEKPWDSRNKLHAPCPDLTWPEPRITIETSAHQIDWYPAHALPSEAAQTAQIFSMLSLLRLSKLCYITLANKMCSD